MKVSVVVCTYTMERYDAFTEAVESALAQTYDPIEVVLVIDGNPEVYERAVGDFGDRENVVISDNDENQGISYSRTRGAELASGRSSRSSTTMGWLKKIGSRTSSTCMRRQTRSRLAAMCVRTGRASDRTSSR